MQNSLAALLLVIALGVNAAAPPNATRFAAATAPYTFSFPRDHFAHDAYRTEWWYFTGHVQSADGHRFGYELTFFRVGLEPYPPSIAPGQSRWRTTQLYPAHFAITDETGRSFFYAETLARGALGQGSASTNTIDVRANGWSLTGTSALLSRMRLSAAQGGNELHLEQLPQKPPAIHGIGGISRKGACATCASHYYSFTRLLTTGSVTRNGVRYAVRGISWMDHEFGSDELSPTQVGWDWFSIQLDDRREIMLYRLRERDGSVTPQSSGSIVAPDGGVRRVSLRNFTIEPRGTWTSPHTKAVYPSGWIVRVNGLQPLLLVPSLDDQELADPDGTTYWEGSVAVRDPASGRSLGRGYVELTGYAAPVRL